MPKIVKTPMPYLLEKNRNQRIILKIIIISPHVFERIIYNIFAYLFVI